MRCVPPLGVGLVYWPELQPLFRGGTGLVQVLELEPQTLWEKRLAGGHARYQVNHGLLQRVAALPQAKLAHGVGQPVGGACDDPLNWCTPWARSLAALRPAWASEHLSFNRFVSPGGTIEETSFLLPPRQTAAGAARAAANLRRLHQASGVPVAFETGVNYLQPRDDELHDGDFFAAVATQADCGILLDLHNLWANQRNGRPDLHDVLARLPLERVVELHLAGGSALDGWWLDAHDGLADPALIEHAAALLPRLPNLGAIVFEILPQYIEGTGLDRIARQLDELQALWRLRPAQRVVVPMRPAASWAAAGADPDTDLPAWEQALGGLVLGRTPQADAFGLAADPGIPVFQRLVREFRCGRIVRVLRYTVLALLRHLPQPAVDALMASYCRECPSDLYTAAEAETFADFVQARLDAGRLGAVPLLAEVLAFERAMVRASLRGEGAALHWSVDPARLIEALESGAPLHTLPPCRVAMEVTATADQD